MNHALMMFLEMSLLDFFLNTYTMYILCFALFTVQFTFYSISSLLQSDSDELSDSVPRSRPTFFSWRTNSGLRDRTQSACQISIAEQGSKSLISGELSCTFRRSFSLSVLRLERQSDLTCFIMLNARSQSAVVAGMDRMQSKTSRTSGKLCRHLLLIDGQVLSKISAKGLKEIKKLTTI